MMKPGIRRFALTAHVMVSVGWVGAVAAFLALSIAGMTSRDVEVVRASYLSMNLICAYIIVPLGLAALATGLIQSLGTQWGLFRHYWVLVKFLLTSLSVVVLLMHQFSAVATAARLVSGVGILPSSQLASVGFVLLRASGLGLLVLLAVTTLSVYKPWGLTEYGRRKQDARRSLRETEMSAVSESVKDAFHSTDEGIPYALPGGLQLFVLVSVGVVLVVFIVSMHLTSHAFHHGH